MKKIISFSLWCQDNQLCKNKINENKNMYCNGAIRNLEIQKEIGIYKDWTLRFYINDTVPISVQDKLKQLGGELINMTNSKIPGMFWRFLAFDDPSVDIFIVRDTDSRINTREENAVNVWLKSDKLLHIMRDHPHHYYKILGGMWGYKNYQERIHINSKIDSFLKERNYKFKRMDDMTFLDSIYDSLDGKSLEHDEFFKYKYSQPFPTNEYNNDYYNYIGEIFDENNNCPNKERDSMLLKNQHYKNKIKKFKHLFK